MCKGAHEEYKGDNHCEYNSAKALSDAKRFLSKSISEDPKQWRWINLHTNEYTNLPWSRTPLRFFFHRSIPTVGNSNTPNVAKISLPFNKDNLIMQSTHAANYKQIITLNKDSATDTNRFSIDTGVGAHPFRGNYFDMNRNHLDGNLYKMRIGKQVEEVKTTTLII